MQHNIGMKITKNKTVKRCFVFTHILDVGIALLSPLGVSSTQRRLTSEFGMGSGVPTSL